MTAKTKTPFTPGPWVADCWGVSTGNARDDFPIAHCVGLDHEANARLIAAAPALYEALAALTEAATVQHEVYGACPALIAATKTATAALKLAGE